MNLLDKYTAFEKFLLFVYIFILMAGMTFLTIISYRLSECFLGKGVAEILSTIFLLSLIAVIVAVSRIIESK